MKSKIANLLATTQINHFFTCYDKVFVVFNFLSGSMASALYKKPFIIGMDLSEQSLIDSYFFETIAEELELDTEVGDLRKMIVEAIDKAARAYLENIYSEPLRAAKTAICS